MRLFVNECRPLPPPIPQAAVLVGGAGRRGCLCGNGGVGDGAPKTAGAHHGLLAPPSRRHRQGIPRRWHLVRSLPFIARFFCSSHASSVLHSLMRACTRMEGRPPGLRPLHLSALTTTRTNHVCVYVSHITAMQSPRSCPSQAALDFPVTQVSERNGSKCI